MFKMFKMSTVGRHSFMTLWTVGGLLHSNDCHWQPPLPSVILKSINYPPAQLSSLKVQCFTFCTSHRSDDTIKYATKLGIWHFPCLYYEDEFKKAANTELV